MFRSALSLVLVLVIFLGLITAQFTQADEDQLFLDLLQQIDSDGQIEPDPLEELKRNAAYSSIARCLTDNITSITRWSCKWCKQEVVPRLLPVKAGLTSPSKLGWYVGYSFSTNQIYVVFKSSGGIENWLLNLDYAPVDYPVSGCPGCKVHKGFYHAYKDELRPKINDALKDIQTEIREKYKRENVPIIVTGHSLGAAMTTFAALDLPGPFSSINIAGIEYWHNHSSPMFNDLSDAEYLNLHNTALSLQQSDNLKVAKFNSLNEIPTPTNFTLKFPIYNYGSPRVGNQQFSDFFQKTIGKNNFFRVTHRADPVPHVPTLTMHAIHVGQEIWFPNKDADTTAPKTCSQTTTEDPACSNSQFAIAFMDHKWYGGWSMLQDAKDSC